MTIFKEKILLFGLGSEILTDDGVGTKIVKSLQEYLDKDLFDFKSEFIFSLDSMFSIKNYNSVIFFDATITKNKFPGEISLNTLNGFEETLHLSNVHELGFKDYFKTWKNLEIDIPEYVFIISVEIEDYTKFGEKLSEKVQEKFPDNINFLRNWLAKVSVIIREKNDNIVSKILENWKYYLVTD